MEFIYNDGGRAEAGFKGKTGDCVVRAIAIAAQLPYAQVYRDISERQRGQRRTKRTLKGAGSVRNGTYTRRKWFKDYMAELGWQWVPTMQIGSGCKVHLAAEELPAGRLIVSVSRHYTAVLDGVIHDTHNPARETHCIEPYHGQDITQGKRLHPLGDRLCWIERRCVYGYWTKRDPC